MGRIRLVFVCFIRLHSLTIYVCVQWDCFSGNATTKRTDKIRHIFDLDFFAERGAEVFLQIVRVWTVEVSSSLG